MLVFMNAFTGQDEAEARCPPGMTRERFAAIERSCREGKASSVADDLCAIMDAQPHPGCFLVVVDR